MGFCKAARIIGYLGVIFGGLRVGMGVLGAVAAEPSSEFARRYLGTATTGEAIEEGFYMIVVSILIGAIGEIGMQLAKPRA